MMAKTTVGLISTFIVWTLPWVLGIWIASLTGALAPIQPTPVDENVAAAAAIEFIFTLAVFILLIRLFGLKLLALGSMITVGLGVMIFLNLVLDLHIIPAFALTLAFVVLANEAQTILTRNLIILLGILGLGLYIGTSFAPPVFLGFLIILGVYDLIAAASGFLPSLVKQIQKTGTPMFVLIVVPETLSAWIHPSKSIHVRAVGTGDLFAPLLLFASFAAAGQVTTAWICAVGASIGVLADLYIIQHYRPKVGIPALPTIVIGVLVAYAVAMFIAGTL